LRNSPSPWGEGAEAEGAVELQRGEEKPRVTRLHRNIDLRDAACRMRALSLQISAAPSPPARSPQGEGLALELHRAPPELHVFVFLAIRVAGAAFGEGAELDLDRERVLVAAPAHRIAVQQRVAVLGRADRRGPQHFRAGRADHGHRFRGSVTPAQERHLLLGRPRDPGDALTADLHLVELLLLGVGEAMGVAAPAARGIATSQEYEARRGRERLQRQALRNAAADRKPLSDAVALEAHRPRGVEHEAAGGGADFHFGGTAKAAFPDLG